MMQIENKFLRAESARNQIALCASGVLNVAGLHQIFVEINRLTEFGSNGDVLLDLGDATYALQVSEIDDFIARTSWPRGHKIAILAARRSEHFNQMSLLSACLLRHGFAVAVFYDANVAIEWLRHRGSALT